MTGISAIEIACRNMDNVEEVRTIIPRRADLIPERGVLIVAAATHKRKNMFFFLLQVKPLSHAGKTCVLE